MKKVRADEEIVITRPSTTLIQSKFVVNQARLFQLAKRTLEGKWLKPQSEAMYIHLFHQILKQQKSSSSSQSTPISKPNTPLFPKYLDMPNIIKQFKFCILNRLANDRLKSLLDWRLTRDLKKRNKLQKKTTFPGKWNILELKQQDPMKRAVSPKTNSSSKHRLRFNQQENHLLLHHRNALGLIQKQSPNKQQDYGLQSGVNKAKPLLKHKKCLSNFNNYQQLDSYEKELIAKLPKVSKQQNNYYQTGLGSQYLTKHTSPQKSLKSSRKGSLKRQSLIKKKVSSQKVLLKNEAKPVKK